MSFTNKKKIKDLLKYFYDSFIPEYIKVKLGILINPLSASRLTSSVTIRTENYFEACQKELKKEKINIKKIFFLHKAFKKYQVRSDLIDDQWWLDFITLNTVNKNSAFQKINKSLINRIETSNFNSLEYYEILEIYNLCVRSCLFELGYYIRKKSLLIALNYPSSFLKKNQIWKLKSKLLALLETENFFEFEKLILDYKTKNYKEKYLLEYFKNFLIGNKILLHNKLINKTDFIQDLQFKKFIEGKKIVIVGPSPVNKKDGLEIDKADIVIRTNYFSSIKNFATKGLRCDINYFNLETVQSINEKKEKLEWPSDIKWIICKTSEQSEIILKKLSNDGINIQNLKKRYILRIGSSLFNGSLLALPNIIIDLLGFNPKEIFCYHFDMMLSKERISGYYPKISTNDEYRIKVIKSLPAHDPVTNFEILKTLWKKGFIKGDLKFEEVIKMKTEDYMRNLQKNYRLI